MFSSIPELTFPADNGWQGGVGSLGNYAGGGATSASTSNSCLRQDVINNHRNRCARRSARDAHSTRRDDATICNGNIAIWITTGANRPRHAHSVLRGGMQDKEAIKGLARFGIYSDHTWMRRNR